MPTVLLDLPFTGLWLTRNSPAARVPSHGTDLCSAPPTPSTVSPALRPARAAGLPGITALTGAPAAVAGGADRYRVVAGALTCTPRNAG